MGYRNIKIYNGGLKDWKKSGHNTECIQALPSYKAQFINNEELFNKLTHAESLDCKDTQGNPLLTILDLRFEHHLKNIKPPPLIKTSCSYSFLLMDDMIRLNVRKKIPKKGLVVTVTETGNRDKFAMRYLSQFGYKNIFGLLFGMRGWIKADYPTEITSKSDRK